MLPACALALVTTGGVALTLPVWTPTGPRDLPHGSLLRVTEASCEGGGVLAEVLSIAGWYPAPRPVSAGQRVCLSPDALRPVTDEAFVVLQDVAGAAAGDLLGRVTDPRRCDAVGYPFTEGTLAVGDLAAVRAVAPDVLAGVAEVRQAYSTLYGPIPLHQVPWTDWGRVGLPMVPLSPAALEAELARESLVTPAQRERAVVAEGPAWTHFLGSDPPGSDTWANPRTVVHLMRLAKAWSDQCGDSPGCTLSIGDLSWYNDTRPDPLGHKDHEGECVDLRLFRSDGSRYEAWWNRPDDRSGESAYDRGRTLAFLKLAVERTPVREVIFNDPEVRAAVPMVKARRDHDDHVHLCFDTSEPPR